jgi:hypothetical protein
MAPQPSVFISYAHKDGAQLAQRLQADFTAKGFNAWLDKRCLTAGAIWTTKIEHAIDRAQVVLALMTPGSDVFEICRAGSANPNPGRICIQGCSGVS